MQNFLDGDEWLSITGKLAKENTLYEETSIMGFNSLLMSKEYDTQPIRPTFDRAKSKPVVFGKFCLND